MYVLVRVSGVCDHLTAGPVHRPHHPLHLGLLVHSDAEAADDHLVAAHEALGPVHKVPGAHHAAAPLRGHLVGHTGVTADGSQCLGLGQGRVPAREIIHVLISKCALNVSVAMDEILESILSSIIRENKKGTAPEKLPSFCQRGVWVQR